MRLTAFALLFSIGMCAPSSSFARNIADLNADMLVDTTDMGMLMSDWGTANATSDIDGNGIVDSSDLRLLVDELGDSRRADHLLRRITFGPSPALRRIVDDIGTQAYLEQQLTPGNIDDSEFQARIAGLAPATTKDLKSWTLLHMVYSKRQLLEVMTWFWDNHFNTDINTLRGSPELLASAVDFERGENQAFRANALGNFRQLLEISSKSPAMLLYLNSAQNKKGDSNENYARELLELHTMGVDGGYTHLDIEAGAEIFTGWHLQSGAFFFNAPEHNSAAQVVLGVDIPSGGVEQGEALLDALAAHRSTATFICTKLTTLFVSDTPPSSLISRCADTFQNQINSPGQIASVLRVILNSDEFFDARYYLGKIKTPLELAVSIVRVLNGETTGFWLQNHVGHMGLELYENPLPTGWSETGDDWMSSGLLLERMKMVEFMLRVNDPKSVRTDLLSYFSAHGVTGAGEIVDFLLSHLLGKEYPDLARQQALTLLNGNSGFNLSHSDADRRLRHVVGAIMSYPQFQYQ